MELLLHLLLSKLGFNMPTIWNVTFHFSTVFRVVTTEGDKLFANRASIIAFPFATFCMIHKSLHFHTTSHITIRCPTVGSMDKGIDTTLNRQQPLFLRIILALLINIKHQIETYEAPKRTKLPCTQVCMLLCKQHVNTRFVKIKAFKTPKYVLKSKIAFEVY